MLGIAGQTFQHALIVLQYQLNKNYIAKNLCVNRNKPQMHCNGKCHLAKELKKANQQEEKSDNPYKDVKPLQLFARDIYKPTILCFCKQKYLLPFNDTTLLKGWPDSAFHPPTV